MEYLPCSITVRIKRGDVCKVLSICTVSTLVPGITLHSWCICRSWTIRKAECQRIDAFGLRCWRRLLKVPWTARGSNKSILKEINPEYSLEGLMLKLKCQYFGYLIQRAHLLEKTLMLGKFEGRRRGCQSRNWLDGITSPTQ